MVRAALFLFTLSIALVDLNQVFAQPPTPQPPTPPGQQQVGLAYEQLRLGLEQLLREHRDEAAALRKRIGDLDAYARACADAPTCWVPAK